MFNQYSRLVLLLVLLLGLVSVLFSEPWSVIIYYGGHVCVNTNAWLEMVGGGVGLIGFHLGAEQPCLFLQASA